MRLSARRFGPAVIGMVLWLGAAIAAQRGRPRFLRSQINPPFRGWIVLGVVALAALLALYAVLTLGRHAVALQAPNPALTLMVRYGCAGCHTIPGVPGARGQAGPSLAGDGRRLHVAGAATNNSGNLVRWLVDPRTAMPVTGISEAEASAVAAYLLRQH